MRDINSSALRFQALQVKDEHTCEVQARKSPKLKRIMLVSAPKTVMPMTVVAERLDTAYERLTVTTCGEKEYTGTFRAIR